MLVLRTMQVGKQFLAYMDKELASCSSILKATFTIEFHETHGQHSAGEDEVAKGVTQAALHAIAVAWETD